MWYVYVRDNPGNPWGPFRTKKEATEHKQYLERNFTFDEGRFRVGKEQALEQAGKKAYK